MLFTCEPQEDYVLPLEQLMGINNKLNCLQPSDHFGISIISELFIMSHHAL